MSIVLWCLFAASLLHFVTKIPLAKAQARAKGGYDNSNPRQQQAALEGRGQRALAAHQNQMESFPLFATGVLVAVMMNVQSAWITYLAVAYVVSRIAYLYCYLADLDMLRSSAWLVGFASSLALICSPAWG